MYLNAITATPYGGKVTGCIVL